MFTKIGSVKANVFLVPGIGHRVKSRNNPDLRVSLVKEFVHANFPKTTMLDYAEAVETVTTSKKDNLILNVDGCVAVCFVDLLRNCGAFSPEEAEDYLKMGVLNGLFVLGRSIGLIAHFLDQKRLRTGLYRHPWDDIVSRSIKSSAHQEKKLMKQNRLTSFHLSQPTHQAPKAVSRSRCPRFTNLYPFKSFKSVAQKQDKTSQIRQDALWLLIISVQYLWRSILQAMVIRSSEEYVYATRRFRSRFS